MRIKTEYLTLILLSALTGCQTSLPPTGNSVASDPLPAKVASVPILAHVDRQPPKLAPSVKVSIEPQPMHPQQARLQFEITMPSLPTDGFRTQAIAANNINWLKLEIAGLGIATPIWADGANGSGLVANAGGTFTLTVSNVPYGKARRATLSCYDTGQTAIPGAVVKGVFDVNAASTNVELSYKTTPTAEVLEHIGGSTANDYLASTLDLNALQSFVNTLSGVSGTVPNYTYTTHPSLLVGSAIATTLLGNGGNIAALNPATAAYKTAPGTVNFTLAGLIGPDTATVNLRDPASGAVLSLGNGGGSVTGVTPGTWLLEATAPGYVADTNPSVTVGAGGTVNAGTISFSVAAAPQITSLSVSNGIIGSSIQINGTNFHSTTAGNTVDFNGTVATVTAASPTQLTVTVPSGLSGSQNVRVTVGGQASNTSSFAITPNITSLSAGSGTIGNTLQLNGTGFDPVAANNTVKLGSTIATVAAASNTQLTVTIPEAPNGDFTTKVGSQTSAGIAFNVLNILNILSPSPGLVSGTGPIAVGFYASSNPITKVEFFVESTKIGESTVSPYSFNWDSSTTTSGAHSLTAKLTDNQNNTVTSPAVNVTVNQLPVISSVTASLNPVPGLSHSTQLTCNATDSDNTLTPAAYTWSTVGGTFGSFSSTSGSQVYWTAPASAGGPYTIRCTVNDGVNAPVTQDLSVSVLSGTGSVTGNGGLF